MQQLDFFIKLLYNYNGEIYLIKEAGPAASHMPLPLGIQERTQLKIINEDNG